MSGRIVLGLAGDTMLGRGVAERVASAPVASLVAPEVVEIAREADLFVLNLECCISDRGRPWPSPGKPFFFRAPPAAVDLLTLLRVDCVTLANNHALDFGQNALLDTLELLRAAGIQAVGAGPDLAAARAPIVLGAEGVRVAVVGITDHPRDFAAGPDRPGVAFADLRQGIPPWLTVQVRDAATEADAVLVTPHWGPNMTPDPVPHVRAAAGVLAGAGAALIAGHSAHVFHGVEGRTLYDLGDFLDDYARDSDLRNDLGLLWLVTLDAGPGRPAQAVRLETVPLKLEYCHTRLARGDDLAWIRRRFTAACEALGSTVSDRNGRLVVDWS